MRPGVHGVVFSLSRKDSYYISHAHFKVYTAKGQGQGAYLENVLCMEALFLQEAEWLCRKYDPGPPTQLEMYMINNFILGKKNE